MASANRTIQMPSQSMLRQPCACNASYIDAINERIEQCNGTLRSNCIGTALFVTGEIRTDVYVDTSIAKVIYLDKLRTVDMPIVGCIVTWEYNSSQFSDNMTSRLDAEFKRLLIKGIHVAHMGIVYSLNPLLVSHRKGYKREFIESQLFMDIDLKDYYDARITYYIPKELERTLSEVPASKA